MSDRARVASASVVLIASPIAGVRAQWSGGLQEKFPVYEAAERSSLDKGMAKGKLLKPIAGFPRKDVKQSLLPGIGDHAAAPLSLLAKDPILEKGPRPAHVQGRKPFLDRL